MYFLTLLIGNRDVIFYYSRYILTTLLMWQCDSLASFKIIFFSESKNYYVGKSGQKLCLKRPYIISHTTPISH